MRCKGIPAGALQKVFSLSKSQNREIYFLLWMLLGVQIWCLILFLRIIRQKARRSTKKWIPGRLVMFSHQWANTRAALPQSSVLKLWYLGFLLFSAENILIKTVGAVFYKIVEFPDYLIDVPQVLWSQPGMKSIWSESQSVLWSNSGATIYLSAVWPWGKLLNFSEPHFPPLCICCVPHF